jgi:uncharacterized membrane protein
MTRFHTSRIVWIAAVAVAAALPATAAVATSAAAATTTYTVTDLGSLSSGSSVGLAISSNGQVTGYSFLPKVVKISCLPGNPTEAKDLCPEQEFHAFVYSNGTMTDLGTLDGGTSAGGCRSTGPGRWSAPRTPGPCPGS